MNGALAVGLQAWLSQGGSILAGQDGAEHAGPTLMAHAGTVADALRRHQVQPNEPVHLTIANRPLDLATLLGIWQAGAVAVPLHRGASVTTREAVGEMTGARFQLDGTAIERLADTAPAPRALLAKAALVIFTSGSTGTPKGVVIGHDAFAAKLDVLDRLLGLEPDDVVLAPLQLTFIFGLWTSLLAIRSGARLVLVQRFSPEIVIQSLAAGASVLAAVPSMLRTLMAERASSAPRLRQILTGGEALGTSLAHALGTTWPQAGIYDLYGSTETGSCDFVLGPSEHGEGGGSIGRPTERVRFRLMRDDGTIAPDGEAGEIQIATPFGMLGYLDNPGLTQTSISGGFFRTGDLGRQRPDGRMELVGRSKEIISRGGNKIAPLELDNILCSHPEVAAALCAGVPDARLGEAIHAAIVLRPGSTLTDIALREWLAARLERFKLPDVIHLCDTLPVGATGKASRAMVCELARTSN